MCDSKGVINTRRTHLNKEKQDFVADTPFDTLAEALTNADVFLGLSVANILTEEMIRTMAPDPIVFALANPDPEITYEKAMHSRKDIIFATGRSDYPNQINNVLGFPYIFRGALDVQACGINEEMKLAAAYAIADLTKEAVPENVKMAYNEPTLAFGRDYIIPKPLDNRLISRVAPAVAKAAIQSGIARKIIYDWEAYDNELEKRMGHDNRLMRMMINKARSNPKRIVFAEGEDLKILSAIEEISGEGIAHPILIGNKAIILRKIKENKLNIPTPDIFDPQAEQNTLEKYTELYYARRQRAGILPDIARKHMQNPNYIGLMMVENGDADGFIGGTQTPYRTLLKIAKEVVGLRACCPYAAGMHIAVTKKGTFFLADTTVNSHPSAETLECVTALTYESVKQFDIEPVIALTSYSDFGEYKLGSPAQIRTAVEQLHQKYPEMLVDGEMHASVAFNKELRQNAFPFSTLGDKEVNTIIFPNLSSGSIGLGILKELGNHEIIGPILLGMKKPIHILPMDCRIRDIVYLTAVAVSDAQKKQAIDFCPIENRR